VRFAATACLPESLWGSCFSMLARGLAVAHRARHQRSV